MANPIPLKVKFPRSANLDEFIERYAADLSRAGVFIRTKQPLPVGTALRFEFQLQDGTPLFHGEGRVAWTRSLDATRPGGGSPGMAAGWRALMRAISSSPPMTADTRPVG